MTFWTILRGKFSGQCRFRKLSLILLPPSTIQTVPLPSTRAAPGVAATSAAGVALVEEAAQTAHTESVATAESLLHCFEPIPLEVSLPSTVGLAGDVFLTPGQMLPQHCREQIGSDGLG